ncbi:hypothetical protein [Actinophytocola sp.]|uniref:hypothetical protein n=1 Tax=Actinophytocola sp. TaxID=1872138 RepID=UPI0038998EC3
MVGETSHGNEGPAHREAEVIVLAAGLRTGIRIVPLTRSLARRPAVVGAEVAVTARLVDQLPLARSLVVVVPPEIPASSCVLPPVALPGAAVTVTVTRPSPAPHGPGGTLSMYNQHAEALPEAFVEAVAAARRCGLVTPVGNVVLLLQEFVPTVASAVVRATADTVRIEGRWGLAEQRSAADVFEVSADGPVSETLARKPTASLAAAGGTHTVPMPDERQHRSSLGQGTIRQLAALSREAAVTTGLALSLDIVLGDREPVVLRCRPSTA